LLGSRWRQVALVVIVLGGASVALPVSAHAQTTVELNQIDATPKGTIGFGLIGAELGLAIPGLIGLDQAWVYCVASPVAAGGFAVMGYYLVDQRNLTGLAVASLVVGMALIVPTMIITVSGLRYEPEDEFDVPPEQARAARARRIARAGDGLFRVSEEGLLLGFPGIATVGSPGTRPSAFGVSASREIRVSLVTGVF